MFILKIERELHHYLIELQILISNLSYMHIQIHVYVHIDVCDVCLYGLQPPYAFMCVYGTTNNERSSISKHHPNFHISLWDLILIAHNSKMHGMTWNYVQFSFRKVCANF